MKRRYWELMLAFVLVACSAALYALHYLIFHDAHHIFIYLLGDVAFLPLEVLIVTLIIHGILSAREKKTVLSKLNMVIGVFFNEVGTELLRMLSQKDRHQKQLKSFVNIGADWDRKNFQSARKKMECYASAVACQPEDFYSLREFLMQKRDFLLRLLENPVLLEHRSFTDLLWAVFHLTEELLHREYFDKLPQKDVQHLSGDIKRVYGLLILEWLDYMAHLKAKYPYLYSLAIRINPLNATYSVEIT